MKKYFVFICLLLSVQIVFSQDLIVTSENDSINCNIKKITQDYYYYNVHGKPGQTASGSVKSYVQNFYKEHSNYVENKKRFMLSFYGGYSRMTAKNSEMIDNSLAFYYDELKTSKHYKFDLNYCTHTYWGFGLYYNTFSTSNSQNNVAFTDSNNVTRVGKLADNITLNTFGLTASKRFNLTSFFSVEPFAAVGYLSYKNNCVLIDKYLFKGSTLVTEMGLKLNVEFVDNLFLAFSISYQSATIRNFTITDENRKTTKYNIPINEPGEGLNRLDIAGGIRYAF
jgi:hypothetical protein